jgi:hypothetical protein
MGQDVDDVQAVTEEVRRTFGPRAGSSRVLESQQGGYHYYVTVYK